MSRKDATVSSATLGGGAAFVKSLPSDIDETQTLKYLLDIRTGDMMYKDFNSRDLKLLSQLLSVLRFDSGDKIIAHGEDASFIAIVLKGTFIAMAANDIQIQQQQQHQPMRKGEVMGELEFFEGGTRKYDVVAATSGVLGIMSYDDVRLLALTSVDLHMRLLHVLSLCSIKRLRSKSSLYDSDRVDPNRLAVSSSAIVRVSATPKALSRRQSVNAPHSASTTPPPALSGKQSPSIEEGEEELSKLELERESSSMGEDDSLAVASAILHFQSQDAAATTTNDSKFPPLSSKKEIDAELLYRIRYKKMGIHKLTDIPKKRIEPINDLADADPTLAANMFPPLTSPSSGSSHRKENLNEKMNYNYVLYTMRNKIAKQDEQIDELTQNNQKLTNELQLTMDLFVKSQNETQTLKETNAALQAQHDKDIQDMNVLKKQVEQHHHTIHTNNRVIADMEQQRIQAQQIQEQHLQQVAKQIEEHGDVLDEKEKLKNTILNPSSRATSTTNTSGGRFLFTNVNSTNVSPPFSPATSSASQSNITSPHTNAIISPYDDYTATYEQLVRKLKDKLADAEKQLIQMNKWKNRAAEFAQTWDNERKVLIDRVRNGLLEQEQLRHQKDSYKILLKVFAVKQFMQQSFLRKQLRSLFKRICALTTQTLIEQKLHMSPSIQSVQHESHDDLAVRTMQRTNSYPWSTTTRAPLRVLVTSIDDEFGVMMDANQAVLEGKKKWQETAESFFQRNVELTQTVANQESAKSQDSVQFKDLQAQYEESQARVAYLETELSQLQASHTRHLHDLAMLKQKAAADLSEKKTEIKVMFERSVDLKRRCRELETYLEGLEQVRNKTEGKLTLLYSEQKRLQAMIAIEKKQEQELARLNKMALTHPASHRAPHSHSSSTSTLAKYLEGVPDLNSGNNGAASPHSISNQNSQSTLAHSQSQNHTGSQSSLPHNPASTSSNADGSDPNVVTTIRARSQPLQRPLPPLQPSSVSWAALSTLPPQLLPLSVRTSLQPKPPMRYKNKKFNKTSSSKRFQQNQMLIAHIQKQELDRALNRASRLGLSSSNPNDQSQRSLSIHTDDQQSYHTIELLDDENKEQEQQRHQRQSSQPLSPNHNNVSFVPSPSPVISLKEMLAQSQQNTPKQQQQHASTSQSSNDYDEKQHNNHDDAIAATIRLPSRPPSSKSSSPPPNKSHSPDIDDDFQHIESMESP